MDKLLTLGSVVSLGEEGQIKAMIIGYYPVIDEEKKIYDYNGVLYPFGLTLPGELLQFDQDDIHELLFANHETEKSEAVCKVLPVLHAHFCPDYEKLSELKKKMESPAPAE